MRWNASVVVMVLGAAAAGCFSDDDVGSGGGGGTAPPRPIVEVDAPCSEYDVMSDGTVDTVYRYTYDSDGFLSAYTSEPDGGRGDFTYDANHFELRFAYDSNADGVLELEQTYTRDSTGRVLTYEEREETAVVETGTYTRDGLGRVSRSVISRQGTGGLVPATTDFVYAGDSIDPVSARLVYPAGTTSIVYTSSRDGRMLHADLDDGEDGTVDRTTDVIYDSQRRTLSSIARTMGMITSRREATYNGRGSVTMNLFADSDASQPDDYVYAADYDGDGMLTQSEVTSPSGDYASAAYTDVYKTSCATP